MKDTGDTNADMINIAFYFNLQNLWYSIINLFVYWFISLEKHRAKWILFIKVKLIWWIYVRRKNPATRKLILLVRN